MQSNCILDDIEKARRAYDASADYDPNGGAAEYRVMVRVAVALERIADAMEGKK